MNRRGQQAITIRSNKVADLLRRHMREGRSQADVVEKALERYDAEAPGANIEERLADLRRRLDAIGAADLMPSMAACDAEHYDAAGNPL